MKLINSKLLENFVQSIKDLRGIESVEFIEAPEDVDSDISIRIRLSPNSDWLDINHRINDIVWSIFDKEGEYLAVYREFV